MSEPLRLDSSRSDALLSVLEREREDAIEEFRFERQRAEIAMARVEALRQDNANLRDQLKSALHAARNPPRHPEDADLAERLKLAVDSNRRLERDMARLERELEDARAEAQVERDQVERLQRRIRALEGSLRIAQGRADEG